MKNVIKQIEDKQVREFAIACYNMNSIEELQSSLNMLPDPIDMKEWGINDEQWYDAIRSAMYDKIDDADK